MATPKLAMIPTAYKAGKLYSVLPESGVGDFTFARASEATRVNEDGLIETMGNNVPRLDYTDGGCPNFLLEPQRSNILLQSNQFDTTWILSSSIDLTSGQIGVGGSNNAWLLKRNSTGSRYVQQSLSLSSAKYSYSVYLKAESTNWAFIWSYDGSASVNAYFDLENGVVGQTGGALDSTNIESVGNGWYRCTLIYTQATDLIRIYPAYSNGSISTGTDNGIYIQYAQIEQGSYATSYIPTNGSTVTRVGETCNGSGDAATFNDSEGVLMVEGALLSELINDARISISDGSSVENRITFRYLNDNEFNGQIGFTNGFSETVTLNSIVDYNKIALVYNSTNASIFVNGFKVATNTMSALSGLSQFQFNRFGGSANDFYGNTKQLQYFDSALTDAELETLTSWQSFLEMANAQNYTII